MDTITHGLFGLTIYKAIDKKDMKKEMKYSLLFTSVIGSEIPDIDVISKWWDNEGLYLMWHRGITHSVFLVPLWATFLWVCCTLFWRVKDKRIFYIGLLSVFIHNTSDVFNAWGTGYFEPFSTMRLAFGTISIIDFVVWGIILIGFLLNFLKKYPTHLIFKTVGIFIVLHFLIQSLQGYWIYEKMNDQYEQTALAADFVPWHYKVIGKKEQVVEISDATLWSQPELLEQLKTSDEAGLEDLFKQNPRAKTLYEWAPLVVVVDEPNRYGLYDPRFYRDGQSFLFEYMDIP